jgi:hypothetical protein
MTDGAAGGGSIASRSALLVALLLLAPCLVYVSVVSSMTTWDEIRWIPDDYSYLRQAMLFQDKGWIGGLDTHLESDIVRYLAAKSQELGLGPLTGYSFANPPGHFFIPATGKLAMQYPPGTGFLLSLFPEGFQVRSLFIAGATAVLLITLVAILSARTGLAMTMPAILGSATLLLMIQPSKGSHSMAATIPFCMVLAWLTVRLIEARGERERLLAAGATGLLFGLAVNVRIASVLLTIGCLAVLAFDFLRTRGWQAFLRGLMFVSAFIIGVLPTLVANLINAGGPLATPYGAGDQAHDFGWPGLQLRMREYLWGTRGVALWTAMLATLVFWVMLRRLHLARAQWIAWLVSANLVFNLAYYFTHVAYASYYAIPLAILSLWTLCFAFLASERAAANAFGCAEVASLPQRRTLAATLGAAVAAYVAFVGSRLPPEVIAPPPASFSDPSVIVWAYLNAGMVHRNFDRYAARGLADASPLIQDRVIEAIMKDGRPQLFLNDSPWMQRLIDRAGRFGVMQPAGKAFGYDVYRLAPQE